MSSNNMKLAPVVLCGGSGTRLWPLSRKNHPKQFVPLFGQSGGETLFRRTMDRVGRLDCARAIVVCNDAHRFFVADSLSPQERRRCAILVEPTPRSTAPAAALAAIDASAESGDAMLLLLPSDHVITDPKAFQTAVEVAAEVAQDDKIVVFGISPDGAETGYGYLRTDDTGGTESGTAYKVAEFHEKPSQQAAAEWLARGNCYWNSGMFVCKASVYLEAIAKFEPGIGRACRQAYDKRYDDLGFIQMDADSFSQCRNISIDHAIIERTDNLMLVPATGMGWSDLGSWDALSAVFAEEGNNRVKGDVLLKDATDNIVYGHDRLVGVLGVDNCMVIDTPDAVLVAARDQSQNIKNLVDEMRANNRSEADEPHKVFRPWGSYETLNKADNFHVKRIIVNPGQCLSLQMHHHRSEHWVVVKGSAQVTKGEKVFTLSENESTYIPVQTKHRLENVGDQPLCLIEVQCGDYLEEDDIVRFDDIYGRTKK